MKVSRGSNSSSARRSEAHLMAAHVRISNQARWNASLPPAEDTALTPQWEPRLVRSNRAQAAEGVREEEATAWAVQSRRSGKRLANWVGPSSGDEVGAFAGRFDRGIEGAGKGGGVRVKDLLSRHPEARPHQGHR